MPWAASLLLNRMESNTLLYRTEKTPSMTFKMINPESLGSPRGYSNGVLVESTGRLLFVAGQIGWNEKQEIVSRDFVAQFDRALANVIAVVEESGGTAKQIARLVIYVTDRDEYRARTREVGECYRARMGKHFPAMVLVEVKGLLEADAKVEIEGIAVVTLDAQMGSSKI